MNDYQVSLMKKLAKEDKARYDNQLPFYERKDSIPEDDKFFSSTDDVQVIINGHRYNLS